MHAKGGAALGLRPFVWSDASLAYLTTRWAQGASASMIATELGGGASRSGVLGKAYRLKLPQPEFKRHRAGEDRMLLRRRGRGAAGSGRRAKSQISALRAAFQALGLEPPDGEPDASRDHVDAAKAFGAPCTLLELTALTCRWPVGTPGDPDFVFCGAAPLRRRPYCVAHCRIAYRPEGGERDSSAQAHGKLAPTNHDHKPTGA